MLAWVMNMGFAASSSGAPVGPPATNVYPLGFQLVHLGGSPPSAFVLFVLSILKVLS